MSSHPDEKETAYCPDPRDGSPRRFFEVATACGLAKVNARRLLNEALCRGVRSTAELRGLGVLPKRVAFESDRLPGLRLEQQRTSRIDSFTKLLFRSVDDLPIETVIIPLHVAGRYTVCLSSQVGCAMGCRFCATARMPKRRSLRTWEIFEQFAEARNIVKARGGRVSGAVFMGMGEPFLNYDRVIAAAELLCFPLDGAIAAKAITISTVGLVPEIDRFTTEEHPFRLSISIGAATDAKRAMLVPVAARYSIKEVMAAARRHALARGDRIMLSYVCISGINVGVEDARALGELIGDTPVRLDLIDVTDTTGRFLPPRPEELQRFRDALTEFVGQPVVRRYSGGKDINAACGTLAGEA